MGIFKYKLNISRTCLSEMQSETEPNSMTTLVSPLFNMGNMNSSKLRPVFDNRQVEKMTPTETVQTKVDWRLKRLLTSPSQLPNCLISISLVEAVVGGGARILIRLTGKYVGQPDHDSLSATFFTEPRIIKIECYADLVRKSRFVQVPFIIIIANVAGRLKIQTNVFFEMITKQNVFNKKQFRPSETENNIVQNYSHHFSGCNCWGTVQMSIEGRKAELVHLVAPPVVRSVHVVTPPGGESGALVKRDAKVASSPEGTLLNGAVHVEVTEKNGLIQNLADVSVCHSQQKIVTRPSQVEVLNQTGDVQPSKIQLGVEINFHVAEIQLQGGVTQVTEERSHVVLGVNHDGDVLANVEVLRGVPSVRAAEAADGTIRVDLEVAVELTITKKRRDTRCRGEQSPGTRATKATRGSTGVLTIRANRGGLRAGHHDRDDTDRGQDVHGRETKVLHPGGGAESLGHSDLGGRRDRAGKDIMIEITVADEDRAMNKARMMSDVTTRGGHRTGRRCCTEAEIMKSLRLYTAQESRNLPSHIRCNSNSLISPAPSSGEPVVVLTITGELVCTDKR